MVLKRRMPGFATAMTSVNNTSTHLTLICISHLLLTDYDLGDPTLDFPEQPESLVEPLIITDK